jgi:hypothetical protein
MEADSLRRGFLYGIAKSHEKPLNNGLLGTNLLSHVEHQSIQNR